jgi:[acyl-carrier-protein] S-malonyltransferase
VNTPADLGAARDLVARHGGARGGGAPTGAPPARLRVGVAGAAGAFVPADGLTEGADLSPGQVIGHISSRRGPVEVAAHDAGTLTEWLAHHDDPVAPGQPLARIGGHI